MFHNNESAYALYPLSRLVTKHLVDFFLHRDMARPAPRSSIKPLVLLFCSAHPFRAHDHTTWSCHMAMPHGHSTWSSPKYCLQIHCVTYLTLNMPCSFVEHFRHVLRSYRPGTTLHTMVMCLEPLPLQNVEHVGACPWTTKPTVLQYLELAPHRACCI